MQTKSSDLGPGSSAGLQTRDGFRFETPRGETSRPRSQARRGPRPAAPPGRHPCTLLWREGKSRFWSRPGTASHQDPASRSFPRVPLVPGKRQKETSGGCRGGAERGAEATYSDTTGPRSGKSRRCTPRSAPPHSLRENTALARVSQLITLTAKKKGDCAAKKHPALP